MTQKQRGEKRMYLLAHSDPSPSLRELKVGTGKQELPQRQGGRQLTGLLHVTGSLTIFIWKLPPRGGHPYSLGLPHQSLTKKNPHRSAPRQSNEGSSSKETSSSQITGCVKLPEDNHDWFQREGTDVCRVYIKSQIFKYW